MVRASVRRRRPDRSLGAGELRRAAPVSSSPRSMRTPLGRVRAHGASGQGTGAFIGQRVSAVALLILGLWFLISVVLQMHGPGFVDSIDFLTSPLNAVGVLLLVVAAFYHMRIGMEEIIEDY